MNDRPFIPYGRQHITQDDIEAVVKTLKSDFLTQGPAIKQFEEAVCAFTGARYAVAVNSNTSGLHIACMALGLGEGDTLWTSPITFVASANCALFCGATVDFVDIDPATYNISIEALKAKLEVAKKRNALPKIVVPVHMCGTSCDMQALAELAQQYGFHIVEDSAHAIGARYRQTPVGGCAYSAMSVFSFHPVKIITTGEGGIVTTNDEALYTKLLRLRTHGITREADQLHSASHGGWYYEMQELSYNYRMTDIQAALGASQMKQLDALVTRRNELADKYISCFSGSAIGFQHVPDSCYSSYHLFPIQVNADARKALFDGLRAANFGVNVHYMPVYLQPYYQQLGFSEGLCPHAERYYQQAISLPLFPQMQDSDVDYVAEQVLALSKVYNHQAA